MPGRCRRAILVAAWRKTVSAWLRYHDGDVDGALHEMQAAASLEDSVDKNPVTPGAVLPARELLGDMLLLSGRPAAALAAYQRSLEISPNRFNSLYGAGRAAALAGDSAGARSYYSALLQNSAAVDSHRPETEAARQFLAGKDPRSM